MKDSELTEFGDSSLEHGLIINNHFHEPVGNVANQSQDGASQHYNGQGAASMKGLAAPLQAISELLTTLVGPGSEELGEFARDEISSLRLKRWISRVADLKVLLDQENIDPQAIPHKLLVSIRNRASLEEDPSLQEKWVRLLASATSGKEIHPSFPRLLADLSADDARFLEELGQNESHTFSKPVDRELSLDVLIRLHICEKVSTLRELADENSRHPLAHPQPFISPELTGLGGKRKGSGRYQMSDRYRITALGRQFLAAVRGPNKEVYADARC